ncbi:protein Flattop isoform X1 [Rhinatrema bivittatum]|uniref:protein Flattop isoform X1 n=1 Tax=Rhinatrema bivittatum TaxID=194408 RepID=UPI001125D576|nr:protein Flattop isoform X1 [Rhinatrema bivittatum]
MCLIPLALLLLAVTPVWHAIGGRLFSSLLPGSRLPGDVECTQKGRRAPAGSSSSSSSSSSMAFHFSANQYQSAFEASHLQSWNIPKQYKEHPSCHDGHTAFITNNRGHLLPGIPRSEKNPWGAFVGTWDMPLKIPPFKASLTSRSAEAAAHLTEWMLKPTSLTNAANGLRPQITGKPTEGLRKTKQSAQSPKPKSSSTSPGSEKSSLPPEPQPHEEGQAAEEREPKAPTPSPAGSKVASAAGTPLEATPSPAGSKVASGAGTPLEASKSPKCTTPAVRVASRPCSSPEEKPCSSPEEKPSTPPEETSGDTNC